MRCADVHFEDRTIRVHPEGAKGSKGRLVPLHPELAAALETVRSYGGLASTGYVVRVRRGSIATSADKPVTRAHGWAWLQTAKRAAVRAGDLLPDVAAEVKTHTFQHSFARHCLANGVLITDLQHWLGHADLETTLIYLQTVPDPRRTLEGVP